jgi:hypothetical protein
MLPDDLIWHSNQTSPSGLLMAERIARLPTWQHREPTT